MAIGRGDLQVSGHYVKFEAAQAGEKTPGEWNGVEPVDGKSVAQQLSFIGEEANIKTDVMANDDGSLDELEKIGKDLLGAGCTCNHFLRDACELDDKRGQAAIRVNEALK